MHLALIPYVGQVPNKSITIPSKYNLTPLRTVVTSRNTRKKNVVIYFLYMSFYGKQVKSCDVDDGASCREILVFCSFRLNCLWCHGSSSIGTNGKNRQAFDGRMAAILSREKQKMNSIAMNRRKQKNIRFLLNLFRKRVRSSVDKIFVCIVFTFGVYVILCCKLIITEKRQQNIGHLFSPYHKRRKLDCCRISGVPKIDRSDVRPGKTANLHKPNKPPAPRCPRLPMITRMRFTWPMRFD